MNGQLIDSLKAALSDITTLTPNKLQDLVKETVIAFQNIQSKVSSKNEWEREEGLQIAVELKSVMEEQVVKLQEKLGMNQEEIETYLANPANFSKEELKSMEESKYEMDAFKPALKEATSAPKKVRKKKLMIVS
jgi:hypothetical protein